MLRFAAISGFISVLAVIVFAGLRTEPLPQAFANQHELSHTLAFALLVCSARLAFPATHALWTVLYCSLLALMVELIQGLLPLRTASLIDMAANLLGVAIGLSAALAIKRQLLRRQSLKDWQQ